MVAPIILGFKSVLCFLALSLLAPASLAQTLKSLNPAKAGKPEQNALQYRRMLQAYSYAIWGPDAPVAALAAQIRQESSWNPLAKSPFACGLTQFTPATAKWIAETYKVSVGPGDCFSSDWAIKAMVQYMAHLKALPTNSGVTACDNYKFALRSYNGGAGWIARDRILTAHNKKNHKLAEDVRQFNSGRAPHFFKENAEYDLLILYKWQPLYTTWGNTIC